MTRQSMSSDIVPIACDDVRGPSVAESESCCPDGRNGNARAGLQKRAVSQIIAGKEAAGMSPNRGSNLILPVGKHFRFRRHIACQWSALKTRLVICSDLGPLPYSPKREDSHQQMRAENGAEQPHWPE